MKMVPMIRMIIDALLKPRQSIILNNLPEGKVIDIGGGGEGVIAQMVGNRVVAIDKRMSEIHEARGKSSTATWLVADGMKLPFCKDSFEVVTAFFSCMYMPKEVILEILKGSHRILKKGGELLVWDANIPYSKKLFAIQLQAKLPNNKLIRTIYGVKAKQQSAELFCEWVKEIGFLPEVISNEKHWFLIRASKI
jgi:ubiquinone/menaquinone biosynthesis C-methylase UbiE